MCASPYHRYFLYARQKLLHSVLTSLNSHWTDEIDRDESFSFFYIYCDQICIYHLPSFETESSRSHLFTCIAIKSIYITSLLRYFLRVIFGDKYVDLFHYGIVTLHRNYSHLICNMSCEDIEWYGMLIDNKVICQVVTVKFWIWT